jgi:hypothetical protein
MVNLFNKADVTEPIQNLTGYLYAAGKKRCRWTLKTGTATLRCSRTC